ncbi:MAG: nucleotidyltransferase domain-containing protein [archaeon]
MDSITSRILEVFINEPEKEFHVRQLSKLLNKSPTTISKYLKKLEKEGILKSEEKLSHLLFKANYDEENFKRLKRDYNLKKIGDSKLVDFLIKTFNEPKTIVLFGSYAKGENISNSDIDLFVLSPIKKEISLMKFEEKLKCPVHLIIKSSQEFEKMKEKNPELLNSIINGMVLHGYLEAFK